MSNGANAPPTIDIIKSDDPFFVFDPSPRIPNEKIVGNIIDIKNSTPIKEYTATFPSISVAIISKKKLIIL